jgi:RimJ/RimL family protein N-acetyltransferase
MAELILETARLRLRPITLQDAPEAARIAGRREIADTMISIPHPFSESQAQDWIARQIRADESPGQLVFAVTRRTDSQLIGTVALRDIHYEHAQAELGFWIAVDLWGRGFATEAAGAVVAHAFLALGLNRVCAHHLVRNPASGRVLEKLGMRREGVLRQRVRKWGVFEDVVILAVLREDWLGRSGGASGLR